MRVPRLLCLLLVASCDPLTVFSVDFRERALDRVATNESQWRAANVGDYDINFERDCLGIVCDPTATTPVIISVRNAAIVRVRDTAGADVESRTGVSWPTVDSMYLWIRQVLGSKQFALEVVFDTVRHFPAYVRTDDPGRASVQNYLWNLEIKTAGAPAVSSDGYWMTVPFSKSKRVDWRSR